MKVPEFVKLLFGLYKKSKSCNLILLLIVYIACVYFVYLFLFYLCQRLFYGKYYKHFHENEFVDSIQTFMPNQNRD